MRVFLLLATALALASAEDKASIETADNTKEDLSPEASGRSKLQLYFRE
jgi:hypothetical protein